MSFSTHSPEPDNNHGNDNAAAVAHAPNASVAVSRKLTRVLLQVSAVLIALLVVLLLGLVGLCRTELGTQKTLQLVQNFSGGALKISGISGRLADQLQIDELSYQSSASKVLASGIRLTWRPRSLFTGLAEIDVFEVTSLKLAFVPDPSPAQLPLSLQLPIRIDVKRAAIGRLSIATLHPDGSELPTVQLTALSAQWTSNDLQHQLQGGVTSPWGKLQVQSSMASLRPYKLDGRFTYHGQMNPALPNLGIEGSVGGSLEELSIQGKAIVDPEAKVLSPQALNKAVLQGGFDTVLKVFSDQPLRSLHANITGLNPGDFAAVAPQANLQVQANLSVAADKSASGQKSSLATDALSGSIAISNTQPARIDQQGLPLLSLRSDLHWSKDLILLKSTQIKLPGNAKLSGDARIQIQAVGLPLVTSRFDLSGIDLAQLDLRLQKTKLGGSVQMQTHTGDNSTTVLDMQTRLSEPRASLTAEASYQLNAAGSDGLLKLTKFELLAANSRIQGQGEISFANEQAFNFKGELRRFDPSRWVAGPGGSIDADLSVRGQLLPKLSLRFQVPRLQGAYAGQALAGAAELNWLDNAVLEVSKLDLHWGRNAINGRGIWGSAKDVLQLTLDAPDLPALSVLAGASLTGSIQADARLSGKLAEPSGHIRLNGQGIGIGGQVRLTKISVNIDLEKGLQGALSADLQAQELRTNLLVAEKRAPNSAVNGGTGEHKRVSKLPLLAEQLTVTVSGRRDAHKIEGNIGFNTARQLLLSATGGVKNDNGKTFQWLGQLERFSLSGNPDIRLSDTMSLEAGAKSVRLGSARFDGALGSLAMEQFEWMPGSIKTRGKMSNVKVIELLNLLKPQSAVDGDLLVAADWDLQLKENIRGEVRLQRQSGDIRVMDVDGTGKPFPLQVKDLQVRLALGGLVAGTDAERVSLQLDGSGVRSGSLHLSLNSQLRKVAEQWSLPADSAINGKFNADLPDLQWMGPWINSGLALKGKLKVDANLGGIMSSPKYQAQIEARDLELAFASEGLLLPNGSLSAQLDENRLKLIQLQFSNAVTSMPQHAKFREQNWIGQKGEFNATGEIDWHTQSGSIEAKFQKFPLLQRKDRWIVVSGDASINQSSDIWALAGKITTDGAYFKLAKLSPPSLSSDVIVKRGAGAGNGSGNSLSNGHGHAEAVTEEGKKGIKTRIDVSFDMGKRFVFTGRGIDTALAGSIRLRSIDGSPLQATGSIRTVGGVYEGYGQQLEIDRGILNFQGSPTNPGLNIRALRTGLEVEAGVEVVGTVASPQVRLVSEPSVPDAEKLSWLVLGRGSNQTGGGDASLLMSAAGAIFGGDGSRNVPREIVQGLGFDEFSVGAADVGGASKLPGQTVAGSTSVGGSSGDQVVSVGKRLLPGLVLSVERGLSDASGAVKLSWQLTRNISIVGRSGTESSIDTYYTFSFH
jgi:translocation and assembly module TamB